MCLVCVSSERIPVIERLLRRVPAGFFFFYSIPYFSTHPGPYIISNCVQSIFLREMRNMAKKYHGTRIKSIEVDNNLDHVDLVITY